MRRVLFAFVFALLAISSRADVYIHPTFGDPGVIGENVLFTSPDAKRLIAISRTGQKSWEVAVRDMQGVGVLNEHAAYIQDGRIVWRIEASTGRKVRIGSIPAPENVEFYAEKRAAWSRVFEAKNRFVFRDFETLQELWENDAIESVNQVLPDRLLVITAVRHLDAEDQSYTLSDAKLEALDRVSGRRLWSYTFQNGDMPEFRSAIVGNFVVIADSQPMRTSELVAIDWRTGSIANRVDVSTMGAEDVNDVEPAADGLHVYVLEYRGTKDSDLLGTLSVPDFRMTDSLVTPAKENLFFHVDGTRIVTSGIYSVAGFDLSSRTKLWEIDHQLLADRPSAGVMYASYSDAESESAVIVRVDLSTGNEERLYEELLPRPSRADIRRQEKLRKQRDREAEAQRKKEAGQRLPVGKDFCLAFDNTGIGDIAEYLHFRADGVVSYIDADTEFPIRRFEGRWKKSAENIYSLTELPFVRDLHYKNIRIAVGALSNVELLPDLRERIYAFLVSHPEDSFTREQVKIAATAPDCPPEALEFCNGEEGRILEVDVFSYLDQRIPRDDVESLIPLISEYLKSEYGTLRFRLETYRSYTYANFLDDHSLWKSDRSDVTPLMDVHLDYHDTIQPRAFRVVRCESIEELIARPAAASRMRK